MKKNIIFYACAAAALVFASCQKEADMTESTEQPATGFETITATTLSTKTTVAEDGLTVLWEDGDQIGLYTRTWNEVDSKYDAGWCNYTTTLDTPNASATFVKDATNTNTVDNTSTSGKYFAVYRKGALGFTRQSRDYYAQFAIDQELKVKNGGDFAASIMVATSKDATFQFSHVVSYIKFVVDENSPAFNKVAVSPVNESEYVTSRITVDFSGEEVTKTLVTGNQQTSQTVTITTEDGNDFSAGTYYVAINYGTYADGLKFTFENAEKKTATITTPANVVMKAGAVANVGTIGTLNFESAQEAFKPSLYVDENGVNKGVVFWADPNDPTTGKAVSGQVSGAIEWHTSVNTFEDAASFDTDDSEANFDFITKWEDYQNNKENYKAAYFCESLGTGWRLPSKAEMVEIFRVWSGYTGELPADATTLTYTADTDVAGEFEQLLLQCVDNETGFLPAGDSAANWYWTGQADTSSKKIRRVKVASDFMTSAAKATNKCYVRCVRDVTLQ